MGNKKRLKKNVHRAMNRRLISGRKPVGPEQKIELRKLKKTTKKVQEEINRKAKVK